MHHCLFVGVQCLESRVAGEGRCKGVIRLSSPGLASGALPAPGVALTVRVPGAARRVARTTLPAAGGMLGVWCGQVLLNPGVWGIRRIWP